MNVDRPLPGIRAPLGFLLILATSLAAQVEPSDVKWSHKRGLVEAPFELTLTAEPPGDIRFTTDGSAPSMVHGTVYSEPISIDTTTVVRAMAIAAPPDEAELESDIETHTFLFVDQVKDQPAFPAGYPTEIISRRRGPGRPHTFDWTMDPEVVDDVALNGDLAEHLREIPTLSMVVDVGDLTFMFDNQTQRGVAFERAASLELIYPDHEVYAAFDGMQIDCGIRIQGGGAGDQARKKSFRVLFKKEYGEGTLSYPLFESAVHYGGNAASKFEGVVLRAGGNTNWSKDDAWKHAPSTYLRDPFVRDSQIAISGMGSRSVWVHLYINGYYFGLYNIAERPDEKFAASYLGGEPEDHYAINHGGTVAGDSQLWNELVSNTGLRGLDDPVAYTRLAERIDLEALSDYLLLNWLVGMGDWPHNNFYGGIRNEPPGKIRFFSWDSEYAFWTIDGYLGSNPSAWVHPAFDSDRHVLPKLWQALTANRDFLMTFADRVHRHCFNDGALTDANMQTRFRRLGAFIENAIVAESARWGDSSWGREDDPHTRADDYIPNRDAVLELMDGNVARFIEVLRQRRFYPDIDPPRLPPSSAPIIAGLPLEMENPNPDGAIYYTLDGTDPRQASSRLAPEAILYDKDHPAPLIEHATRVKARVMRISPFGDVTAASALNEQLYLVEPVGFPLRITELMYHPETDEALEFIEFQNISTARLDLTGFYMTGIDYRFAPGTWLEPGEVIVLIPNDAPELFAETYPTVDVFGHYRRHLGNDGETIALHDAEDRVIAAVTYDDDPEAQWPLSADGMGHSLEVIDTSTPHSADASAFRVSATSGGTPGIVSTLADPLDDLALEIERVDAKTVRLHFQSESNRSYTIQTTTRIEPSSEWATLLEFPAAPASTRHTLEATIIADAETTFYRLTVHPK